MTHSWMTTQRRQQQQTDRLSHEEQQELLRKVVEMRRIKQVERDLLLQPPKISSSSTSRPSPPRRTSSTTTAPRSSFVSRSQQQLAQATGYGDELAELQAALAAGEVARERLVTTNMGLVYYCVNDVMSKKGKKLQSVTAEDLVQEGAIGLARAVDRWNPAIAAAAGAAYNAAEQNGNGSNGNGNSSSKFSTYAVYWIRAAILRCIAERDDLMRVPEHVSTAIRKVSMAAQTLGLNLDYYSNNNFSSNNSGGGSSSSSAAWKEAAAAKALAEAAGLTDRQLREALKVRERRNVGILSFDSWMQQGQNYETDLVATTNAAVVADAAANQDDDDDVVNHDSSSEHMKQTLSRFLRPREMEALSWRYGLNSNNNYAPPTVQMKNPLSKRDYVADAEVELYGMQQQQQQLESNTFEPTPVKGKWGEAMSFTEVGKHMQVSAEYGRKLCHAALDKLRRAAEEGALEPALLF